MKRKILAGVILTGVVCVSSTAFAEVKNSSFLDDLNVNITIGQTVANRPEPPKDMQGMPKRPPNFSSKDRPPEPPEGFDGKRPPMSGDRRMPPPGSRSGDRRPPDMPRNFNNGK